MADAVRIFVDGSPAPDLPSLVYWMRAFDSTLSRVVFWESITIDTLGNDYAGPGPLVDVVVQRTINLAI